uniref:Uncharacterized protein n=1 Tax=Amphiprion ocellaris TaxID=80972 RepID=A0A3Q1BWD8_AMPOC
MTLSLTVPKILSFKHSVVYFKDCPQQPNIPNYLLGLALIQLLMVSFVTLPCESEAAQLLSWPTLSGDVWVFSVYQPNYDPTAADGLYCNKSLYTFALWNAIYETFVIGVLLAKFIKGLLCFVKMSPVPANTDFYGQV